MYYLYSEAAFKTIKYCPNYPDRFGYLSDVNGWASAFFDWYNDHHHHSGINMLTPSQVHFGEADKILEKRQKVLDAVFERTPERFLKGPPTAGKVPEEVWINPPVKENDGQKRMPPK